MADFTRFGNSRGALAAGGALLLILGAAAGAGAVQATRPSVEMAPMVQTPIAKLGTTDGVVTVKGRVAEVFGDRFVVQDASGRAMVAAGREARDAVRVGQPVAVQGRFDEGQLRASYLVQQGGSVVALGPQGPHGPHGRPGGPEGPGPQGIAGRDGPPPPPPGCAAVPNGDPRPSVAPPPPTK